MEWIGHVLTAAAIAIGTWLGIRIVAPSDHQRAEAIDRIATGAAALTVSLFPTADWATLLKATVEQMALSAGTRNRAALERAAAAALRSLGKQPTG